MRNEGQFFWFHRGVLCTNAVMNSPFAAPSSSSPALLSSAAEPVRLFTTPAQRDALENQANLFAIVKTAEALERAYARDAIGAAELRRFRLFFFLLFFFFFSRYRTEMFKLISHYKSAREATRDSVPSMAQFLADYQVLVTSALFFFS